MTAINQNFTIYRWNSLTIEFAITGISSGDLANAEDIVWKLSSQQSTSPRIRKDLTDGVSVDGTTITVELTAADIEQAPGAYYHELKVKTADGQVATVAVGTATIRFSNIDSLAEVP